MPKAKRPTKIYGQKKRIRTSNSTSSGESKKRSGKILTYLLFCPAAFTRKMRKVKRLPWSFPIRILEFYCVAWGNVKPTYGIGQSDLERYMVIEWMKKCRLK